MKMQIEGTPEELREFLQTGDVEAALALTPDLDIDRLVVELKWVKDGAKEALQYICENAPTVGFDEVADHVGVDTKVLSGKMSSIGHSAPTVGRLISRDYGRREYLVDPESAKALLTAFEALDA
jgi:hypothetical protein